jgi:4-carboxymuconolactone decarboxylase
MLKFCIVLMAAILLPCELLAQRRMAPIPVEKMTPEQRAAAETFKASRGYELQDHLFMDLLRVPDAMLGAFRMREHIRKDSVFGGPLTEFALLLTLREWSQPQEWSGHVFQAVTAGIKGEVIAAVAEGRYPDGMTSDESIIYNFTMELLRNHSVSDVSYDRMVKRWGEAGVIEAINIAALYTIVGMVLNTTREPIPERYNELPTFPQLKPVPLSTYTNPVSLSAGPPGAPAPATRAPTK